MSGQPSSPETVTEVSTPPIASVSESSISSGPPPTPQETEDTTNHHDSPAGSQSEEQLKYVSIVAPGCST